MVIFALTALPAGATNVSGPITEDTTWTVVGSPYNLVGNLQVPLNYTLTIMPGVVVDGDRPGPDPYKIEVWGALEAIGTSASNITFNEVKLETKVIASGFAGLNIRFAEIKGESSLWVSGAGSLRLEDSRLLNGPQIYLSHLEDDCFIERNIFFRADGIFVDIMDRGAMIYIRNNVFFEQQTDYAIKNATCENGSQVIAMYNSFLSTDRVALRLAESLNYTPDLDGTNNYWNTTSMSIVSLMIYDKSDTQNCSAYIEYEPVLSGPYPSTPSLSDYPDLMLYSYYIPFFRNNAENWTGMGLKNCSTSDEANITATIYSEAGQVVAAEQSVIPARGQGISKPGAGLVLEGGWIKVDSGQRLVGCAYMGGDYIADMTITTDPVKKLYIPDVAYNDIWDTIIYVCNPGEDAGTVTLTYVDAGGEVLYQQSYGISAMGSGQYDLGVLVQGTERISGSVEIVSTVDIAAFALYNNVKGGGTHYTGISAVDPDL